MPDTIVYILAGGLTFLSCLIATRGWWEKDTSVQSKSNGWGAAPQLGPDERPIDSCPHLWEQAGKSKYYNGRRYTVTRVLQCPSLEIQKLKYGKVEYQVDNDDGKSLIYDLLNTQRCEDCKFWAMSPGDVAMQVIAIKHRDTARLHPAEYKQVVDNLDKAMKELDGVGDL